MITIAFVVFLVAVVGMLAAATRGAPEQEDEAPACGGNPDDYEMPNEEIDEEGEQ